MANGGHLKEFKQLLQSCNFTDIISVTRDAIEKYGNVEFLQYTQQISNDYSIGRHIFDNFFYYDTYKLLELIELPEYYGNAIKERFIQWGYLELVDDLSPMNEQSLRSIMQFNHLDVLSHIQSTCGMHWALLNNDNINNVIHHQTIQMFNYLCEHDLIDLTTLQKIKCDKLHDVNPKLYKHLKELDLISD